MEHKGSGQNESTTYGATTSSLIKPKAEGDLEWLPILDEYTRECLSLEVESSISAEDVVTTLERLVEERGAPEYLRSDNGPEPSGARCQKAWAFCPQGSTGGCWQFIAKAVKEWIASKGFATLYIEPGAPWQNPYSESFNARFRDEFLNMELFGSKLEAKVLGKEHREKYNHHRPHSSLGEKTPAEFAQRCFAPLRATPSTAQNIAINPNHQPNLS